ncbi:hypothetical protein GCM10022204_44590 [Microlunatus aurantiacus]|uniref:Orc1-like AAA ATPase domain-containing protein n=1 Tax=Microlunatus aurantiacus TaxID=446786 RepID=A0ABP7EIF1_9ACTN
MTPLGQRGRTRLRTRDTSTFFLDAEGRVKVPDRGSFVGRRRDLQQLLRELRPADPTTGPQAALLTGMGGLGKSSLTARLLDRSRTTHNQHAVWVGKIDTTAVQNLTQRLNLDPDVDQLVNDLLSRDSPLRDRLRFILDGPLADIPCLFTFDDFEDGNLDDDGHGGHLCTPDALEVIEAFGTAINRAGSPSRIIITSRYDFPLPTSLNVVRHPVGQLHGADLEKKLRLTVNLGPTSTLDDAVRQRAIAASAGIPRLLERLDSLVNEPGDLDAQLATIEQTQVEYREELLLHQLLERQTPNVRRTIALAAIYEIAVPLEAILALAPERSIADDVEAAVRSGLIQAGLHPNTGETRYLVSPLLSPLVADVVEHLSASDLRQAQERAAEFLYQLWVKNPDSE